MSVAPNHGAYLFFSCSINPLYIDLLLFNLSQESTSVNEVSSKPEPEPEQEPAPQTQPNGDVTTLSAKEYRERLASKKKPDPRGAKMDFRSKYDMFQQMWAPGQLGTNPKCITSNVRLLDKD